MTTYRPHEVVPNFLVSDANGLPSTINAEMGENGLLVFVLRGTWCVFCVHQLVTTRLRYAKYQQRGVNALFVAPQNKKSVEIFLADLGSPLPFGLHADPYRIITNLLTDHGSDLGIILLNPQRQIEWQYIGGRNDYPSFKSVISALNSSRCCAQTTAS